MSGAAFHKGTSRQTFRTPDDFRNAVICKFGMPAWDLAADNMNAFCNEPQSHYFDEATNSFSQDWHLINGLLYLNCPFSNIRPWARKCWAESQLGARILFLVPASTGSLWFCHFVYKRAVVHFLTGPNYRLKFDGAEDPYPKDLILVEFDKRKQPDFLLWEWRKDCSS